MDSKKIRKSIGRFFGWISMLFASAVVKVLPPRYIYRAAKGMGYLGYLLSAKHRKIALESLNIAFKDEKSNDKIVKIAKDCFTFITKSGMELIFLLEDHKLLMKRVGFEGKENLDEALSRGKGVILVSAHFGNFPLMLARLSLAGYKTGAIMRTMRDSRVEKIFIKKRDRLNIRSIYTQPRQKCVHDTLQALRNNEIVFIPIDQNFGTGGVFVDFFGAKAATATGPVVLAQRSKAVLLPCFIVRQPDDTHKVIFEPPFDLVEAGTAQETIILNIQRLTNIIESYIRRYPAEWGWVHRRWKSRPKKEEV
jgi:Kdo2-lipid IVA lauroyltransferase/acyltransferase